MECCVDHLNPQCIGVVGLGYVGLPLVQEFGKAGFSVIGLDVDRLKVERLSRGESYIRHIPSEGIVKTAQAMAPL